MSRPPDPTRKPQLLNEIVRYLGANGVTELTMRNLANHLGVSTTTLIYQFGSKQGLIDAAVKVADERMRAVAQVGLEDGAGSALRQFWTWVLESGNVEEVPVAVEAVVRDRGAKRRDGDGSIIGAWVTMFGQALERQGLSRERAATEATLIHSALLGLCMDIWDTADLDRTTAAVEALANYADALEA